MLQNKFINIDLSLNYTSINIPTYKSFNHVTSCNDIVSDTDIPTVTIPPFDPPTVDTIGPITLSSGIKNPVTPSSASTSVASSSILSPVRSKVIHTSIGRHLKSSFLDVRTLGQQKITHGRMRRVFLVYTVDRCYKIVHISGTNGFDDTVTVYYPDRLILGHLDDALKVVPKYHVQEIEFTFDFHLQDREEDIYKQIDQICHLKYSGKSKPVIGNYPTIYFGNPRDTATTGGRCYIKKDFVNPLSATKEAKTVSRLELVCKRAKLKRDPEKPNNFGIDSISDLYNIDINKVINCYTFLVPDLERYMGMRSHNSEPAVNILKKTMKLHCDMIGKCIKDRRECLAQDYSYKPLLFKPHPFQFEIVTQLQGKSFLTGDSALVDPDVFLSRVFLTADRKVFNITAFLASK